MSGINRNKALSAEIDVLGDCHLGKVFHRHVPLHRRGEREASVWADFEASLMGTTAKYHVQVGDLFDAFVVPHHVTLRAAEIYIGAAMANPDTTFITYAGNHDLSRTAGIASSFDVFCRLGTRAGRIPNLRVFIHPAQVGDMAFVPWHPFTSAAQLAAELPGEYEHVFGHWDCTSFGGNDHNLISLDELVGKTRSVVTGHEHTPREYDEKGIHVTVVGSMQPYSHAEDPDGEFYVTLTLEELEAVPYAGHPDFLLNRHVRLLLKEGESIPDGVDALSVTSKPVTDEGCEVQIDVDLGQFDMKELLDLSLGEAGVNEAYSAKVHEQFGVLRAAE